MAVKLLRTIVSMSTDVTPWAHAVVMAQFRKLIVARPLLLLQVTEDSLLRLLPMSSKQSGAAAPG